MTLRLVTAARAGDWMTAYEAVSTALVADDAAGAAMAARTLASALADADAKRAAGEIAGTLRLDIQRVAFGELSRSILVDADTDGELALPPDVRVFFCGMAAGFGYWLQEGDALANPYMGGAMPACGQRSTRKVATRVARKAQETP